MKNLEFETMENIGGSDGFLAGFTCGLTVFAVAGVLGAGTIATAGTLGPAALAGTAYVAGAACGGSIGYGLATGDWL